MDLRLPALLRTAGQLSAVLPSPTSSTRLDSRSPSVNKSMTAYSWDLVGVAWAWVGTGAAVAGANSQPLLRMLTCGSRTGTTQTTAGLSSRDS